MKHLTTEIWVVLYGNGISMRCLSAFLHYEDAMEFAKDMSDRDDDEGGDGVIVVEEVRLIDTPHITVVQ